MFATHNRPTIFDPSELRTDVTGKVVRYLQDNGAPVEAGAGETDEGLATDGPRRRAQRVERRARKKVERLAALGVLLGVEGHLKRLEGRGIGREGVAAHVAVGAAVAVAGNIRGDHAHSGERAELAAVGRAVAEEGAADVDEGARIDGARGGADDGDDGVGVVEEVLLVGELLCYRCFAP